MTGQNDRQTQVLSGQIVILAGHCPVTGRYFEPCSVVLELGFIITIACIIELSRPHESGRVWVRLFMFNGPNTRLKYMNSMVIDVQQ